MAYDSNTVHCANCDCVTDWDASGLCETCLYEVYATDMEELGLLPEPQAEYDFTDEAAAWAAIDALNLALSDRLLATV